LFAAPGTNLVSRKPTMTVNPAAKISGKPRLLQHNGHAFFIRARPALFPRNGTAVRKKAAEYPF